MIKHNLNSIKKSLEILKQVKEQIKNKYKYPLDEKDYLEINENDIVLLDTVAYRFSKIQSIMGEKLFKEILEYLEIDVNNKSFIEILAILEREGILNIDKWRELRIIRNSLSHDYPEEIEFIVKALNKILENISFLENVYNKIREKYELASKIKQRKY